MHVGICRLTLFVGNSRSLKDKRQVVRRLKDRTRARFHLPVAEVAGQDTWQRMVLGFAVVGSDRTRVEALVDEVARFIKSTGERSGEAETTADEREILSYGEEPFGEPAAVALADDDSWIPEAWKQGDDP